MRVKVNRILLILLSALLLSGSFSCRKDFSTLASSGNLSFSRDTVFLDTLLTDISSSTYALKVYNKSDKDLHIPTIRLGRSNSFYRLNVDGLPGKSFENVPLRARDSLYIFIEATIDYTDVSNPLYKDSIVFDSGLDMQDVKLITLVKDAHFLYPRRNYKGLIDSIYTTDIRGDSLPKRTLIGDELHFKNDKAYVIYGYCAVPENKTLIIDAGTEVYFHKASALVVEKNASIHIEGSNDQKVRFEGDRLEFELGEFSGQWDGIWLRAGSKDNRIENTLIKNATIGIRCDSIADPETPTLVLKNTQIYNSSEEGLLAVGSYLTAENTLIGNSRKASVALTQGGRYAFNHCTLANHWSGGIRRDAALQISNQTIEWDNEAMPIEKTHPLYQASFTNCIIDGNKSNELFLEKNDAETFEFKFENCLLKYEETSPSELYNFENPTRYSALILNGDPYFKNPSQNRFSIGEKSEAINKGSLENALKSPLDILGVDRTSAPDLGACQHIFFEPEEEEEQ